MRKLLSPTQTKADFKTLAKRDKNILCPDCYEKVSNQNHASNRLMVRFFLLLGIVYLIMKVWRYFQ